METILQKWDEILALVKEEHELTDVSFSTWLKPLKVHSLDETKDGTILYLLVPSAQVGVNYVSKKYTLPLKVAIAEITGINCDVRFILPEEDVYKRQAGRCEKSRLPAAALLYQLFTVPARSGASESPLLYGRALLLHCG